MSINEINEGVIVKQVRTINMLNEFYHEILKIKNEHIDTKHLVKNMFNNRFGQNIEGDDLFDTEYKIESIFDNSKEDYTLQRKVVRKIVEQKDEFGELEHRLVNKEGEDILEEHLKAILKDLKKIESMKIEKEVEILLEKFQGSNESTFKELMGAVNCVVDKLLTENIEIFNININEMGFLINDEQDNREFDDWSVPDFEFNELNYASLADIEEIEIGKRISLPEVNIWTDIGRITFTDKVHEISILSNANVEVGYGWSVNGTDYDNVDCFINDTLSLLKEERERESSQEKEEQDMGR